MSIFLKIYEINAKKYPERARGSYHIKTLFYCALPNVFKFEIIVSAVDCVSLLIPADSRANFFKHVLVMSEAVSLTEFVNNVPA